MEYQPEKVRKAAEKIETELTTERREQLAFKGQRLYYKFCGLNGEGIYAESFAEYHLLRGEDIVVQDLLVFLDEEMVKLQSVSDEEAQTRLSLTQLLIQRIRALAGEAAPQG